MALGKKTGGGSRKGIPNKATADIKLVAQRYGEEAIKTLVDIMKSEDAPHAARVSASKEILDRGYGKSVQVAQEQPDIDHEIADPDADV